MTKGRLYPREDRTFLDERTGTRIRQVTAHASVHHHPFYYLPAYDDAMRRLFFVSHRAGYAAIFCELRSSGELLQLTDRPDLSEWSVHPSHDGLHVYFVAGSGAWRLDLRTLQEEQLADFGSTELRSKGMVGDGMGVTTLTRDDRWWAIPVRRGAGFQLAVVDTQSKRWTVILERDTIAHPEFHPDDPDMLRYAGPYHSRIWVIHRDGTGNRLVFERDARRKQWVVHETWLPGTREIVSVDWPHGMFAVNADNGTVRPVCMFNAWHAAVSRDGTSLIADTVFPDRGLQLFDPHSSEAIPRTVCFPGASSQGAHWNTRHCPYDDGPIAVYAPQHTHPHPAFSPDGSRVVFTSDCTGHAQIYEATIGIL